MHKFTPVGKNKQTAKTSVAETLVTVTCSQLSIIVYTRRFQAVISWLKKIVKKNKTQSHEKKLPVNNILLQTVTLKVYVQQDY